MYKKLVLLLLLICCCVQSYAQVTTSAIDGQIKDFSGLTVPYAIVIATHIPSGTEYYAISNADGYYVIDGMRPGGPYRVEYKFLGYKECIYNNIYLSLGEGNNINVKLEQSEEMLSASIIVTEPKSKFASDKTGAATNISLDDIRNTPTAYRSLAELTRLSAYGGNGMSIAGGDGRMNLLTIDGANLNDNLGLYGSLPAGGYSISIDAIEEFQVAISPYDIRKSNFTNASIDAITKSGTNKFQGSFTYLRMYGKANTVNASLGGPIIKNKLFFFANFESVFFPSYSSKLWRPSEDGIVDSSKNLSRATVADMQAVRDFTMRQYAYDPGSITDYPNLGMNNKYLARIDWNIAKNHKLSYRLNVTTNRAWNPTNSKSMDGGTIMSKSRISDAASVFSKALYRKDNYVWSSSLNLNSRLSNVLHNELLATFTKIKDIRSTNSEPFPFVDILKEDNTGSPQSYISLGHELFSWNNVADNIVVTLKDDITYYAGAHKITGGINYEYQMIGNSYMRNGTSYYRYRSVDDYLNMKEPEVVALSYGYHGQDYIMPSLIFNYLSAYIQDSWSLSDNLKINYGLRLEDYLFDNSTLRTNPGLYNIDYSGNGYHLIEGAHFTPSQEAQALRFDTGVWPHSKPILSARFGFTWDVLGNNKFKLRGGTGMFTGRIPLVMLLNMPTNSGMFQNLLAFNSLGENGAKATDMTQFIGGLKTDSQGVPSKDALLNYLIDNNMASNAYNADYKSLPSSFYAVNPDFRMPQTWKTTLAIDYQFPTSFPLSVTIEGIFNKTIADIYIQDMSINPSYNYSQYKGADNRNIYFSNAKYHYYTTDSGNDVRVPSVYLLGNTDKGYGYIYSLTLNTTPIKNLNIMMAYTRTSVYELTGIPNSKISTTIPYRPNVNGFNTKSLQPSPNIIPQRLVSSISYSTSWGSRLSLLFESMQGSDNYSYMYTNDFNDDGFTEDLIYIPRTADEIVFISEDDKNRFWNFVNNDDYLSKHKGEYARPFSVYLPWVHKLDLHFSQDVKFKIAEQTHKLQFNLDITNFINFLDHRYGVGKTMNSALNEGRILKFEGLDLAGNPTFSTPVAIKNDTPTWEQNTINKKYWLLQFSIKYMFN